MDTTFKDQRFEYYRSLNLSVEVALSKADSDAQENARIAASIENARIAASIEIARIAQENARIAASIEIARLNAGKLKIIDRIFFRAQF